MRNGICFLQYILVKFSAKPALFLLFLLSASAAAQTLPLSNSLMVEQLRIKQLQGEVDSNLSLAVKPVSFSFLDKSKNNSDFVYLPKNLLGESDFLQIKILPFSFEQQFNSSFSYGSNDGIMLPAKGFQEFISGGVFLKAGPLTIQAMPEILYASNPEYLAGNDKIAADRYQQYISFSQGYGADLPSYYEMPNYRTIGIGQSSIRLNAGPVSVGISNENLWWGPGRRNALLMSNNTRGFKHATLNTSRPVETLVGSFEGQIISGRLDNSNSTSNELKNQDWRYLSGMVINYQPKWFPGLFVGLTRAFQIYHSDINGINDYIPLFQPFEKRRTEEEARIRDQLTSVFARFIFKEAQAEVYAEFARNDHSFSIRDFLQEPQHSRAYLFGFQKLIPFNGIEENFLVSAEITQLSQPLNRVLRTAGTWYTHEINQGYTNFGEIIGAGAGPGGNLQSFELSWLKGFKKIGLQIERFEHNRDYYQLTFDPSDIYNEKWVDLSAGILTNWDYKNLLIRGRLTGVQSFNYLWQNGLSDLPQRHLFNIYANVGLHYYLK
jgi:hypothetical protein